MKLRTQHRVLHAEFHRSLQEAQLVTGVVALAFVAIAVNLLVLQQRLDGVGQLQFAARAPA